MHLPWGLAGLLIAVVAATAHAQQGAMEKLECLGSALRSQGVLKAEYKQVYTPAGMAFGEEDQGTVWVGWPDKALFEVGDPALRWMGLDGRQLRLLDLEVPSCDDHRLDDAEWKRIPLAAVLDPRGAVDSFSVLDGDDGKVALVPREAGGVERVEVLLGGDCLPLEILVVDPQGAGNRLVFEQWQKSEGPPAGLWLPGPPAGLQCRSDP